jgi:hypothetical protein
VTYRTEKVVLCFPMVQSVKENLFAAMRHVLRPLCRIAVRNGLRFSDLERALQDAMVNAARVELKNGGLTEVSDEEIGLMAGMTLAQVKAAGEAELSGSVTPSVSLAASQVLAGWHSDSNYAGPYGLVLDVPYSDLDRERSRGHRSFEALVQRYAGETVSPRLVLEELLKSKNVQNLGDGIFRSLSRTYIAERLSPKNIQEFAEAVHNMIGTMAVNLERTVPGTGLLQRTVFADYGLTEEGLKKFNQFIRTVGRSFTEELVDTWFANHSNKDARGPIRTGIGLYHYVENDADRESYLESLRKGAER